MKLPVAAVLLVMLRSFQSFPTSISLSIGADAELSQLFPLRPNNVSLIRVLLRPTINLFPSLTQLPLQHLYPFTSRPDSITSLISGLHPLRPQPCKLTPRLITLTYRMLPRVIVLIPRFLRLQAAVFPLLNQLFQ